MKTVNLILTLIITLAILGAGLYVFNTINSDRSATRTRIDSEILQSRIEQIAELATLNYIYQNVGFYDSQRTGRLLGVEWVWPFTTNRVIFRYDGEVKFGIEFDKVAVDVDNFSNKITVSLPVAKVLSHVVHEHLVEIMDESTGIFSRRSFGDYPEFMALEKDRLEEWLINNGMLEQARANAEGSIRGIIEAIVEQLDTDYEIIFI